MARSGHQSRKRNRFLRPVLAFFKMPGSRGFGLLLIIFISVIVLSVIDLQLNYIDPATNNRIDTLAAMYAVFALLVFETPFPFPNSLLTRLVFFAVPITGLVLLGQGLFRLGRVYLDPLTWSKAMAATHKDHTIVCGLGKVSMKVVSWILDLNEEVVVIDNNPNNPFLSELRDWGVPVVIADARRPEVLAEVNITHAESIVPCTNDDLTNLSIALQARKLVPDIKVVLRMFDNQMADNVRSGFDIHTVFSIPDISAPSFAAAATRAPLDYAFSFDSGDGEKGILTITKFVVVPESVLVGHTVGEIEDNFDVAVIAHRHDGKFTLHPDDDAVIDAGDRFVVSASIPALNVLARLAPPAHELNRYKKGRWPLETNYKFSRL